MKKAEVTWTITAVIESGEYDRVTDRITANLEEMVNREADCVEIVSVDMSETIECP